MSTHTGSADSQVGAASRGMSPVRRQLAWLLLPVAAGVINAVHVLTAKPHMCAGFT